MKNHTAKPNWIRLNCIGKGSFGAVNLAVDTSDHGLTFAVKSVDQNSHDLHRCLENEIRILKSLSSPYVVTYLGDDVTCESSSLYRNLHMEYMPGGTLADVSNRADVSNIRSYTRCITSALKYTHARNLVHCDVKGANVLLGNNPGTAKLADFGSALEFGAPFPGTRGSPLWMAPEVVRGEYVGPESDVWSLGCTVIEILTGNPAWQDRGVDTLRQIGYSDDLPEYPFPIPDDVRDFLNKCLKREIGERWSCDQLLHHPFLLSCSSEIASSQPHMDGKTSPRCVIDWSDDNNDSSCSSNESTVVNHQFDAKQRIGKLASDARVNWELDGWEMVRHVTITGLDFQEPGDVSLESKWECNASYFYDVGSTISDAWGTRIDRYMFNMFVRIQKLFGIFYMINPNAIRRIHYTQWLTSTQRLSSYFFFNGNFINGRTTNAHLASR